MRSCVVLFWLALASQAIEVNFIYPSNGVDWTTLGPNNVSWTYGQGAPTLVNIQLLHYDEAAFDPIEGLLTAQGLLGTAVDITTGMMMLPSSCILGKAPLPMGSGYSLRMYSETPNGTETTLGTSNGTFNIVAAPAMECLGLGNGTLTSSANVRPTATPASASNLSSSSPKSHVAAIAGGVVGGLLACLLVVAATIMYNRHRRDLRKRMTQQFVMKKGLVLGKPTDNKDVEMN